jgi:hypothetical protein
MSLPGTTVSVFPGWDVAKQQSCCLALACDFWPWADVTTHPVVKTHSPNCALVSSWRRRLAPKTGTCPAMASSVQCVLVHSHEHWCITNILGTSCSLDCAISPLLQPWESELEMKSQQVSEILTQACQAGVLCHWIPFFKRGGPQEFSLKKENEILVLLLNV